MNKLTAEKCREEILKLNKFHKPWMNSTEKPYLQALEIALPILEQQKRGEGEWIEWGGAKRPTNQSIEVKFRNGEEFKGVARRLVWEHIGSDYDIIAYHIIPEQPTNQNGEQ